MFQKKDNFSQALVLESLGDQSLAKNHHKKALNYYQKALALHDQRAELYQKLIKCLDEKKESWDEQDFTNSVMWEMKYQELVNPIMKRIHARQHETFQTITHDLQKIMTEQDPAQETQLVEKVISYGDEALYPLVDFLIQIKETVFKNKKK